MSGATHFTAEQARAAGARIGIDWSTAPFDVEQFRMGMDVELEHGTHDPETWSTIEVRYPDGYRLEILEMA